MAVLHVSCLCKAKSCCAAAGIKAGAGGKADVDSVFAALESDAAANGESVPVPPTADDEQPGQTSHTDALHAIAYEQAAHQVLAICWQAKQGVGTGTDNHVDLQAKEMQLHIIKLTMVLPAYAAQSDIF